MGNDELQTLPAVGLLANLSDDIRRRLAAAGEVRDLPVGAYLVSQGKSCHDLSLILSGKFSVLSHAHGSTAQLAFLGPGEFVGEMNVIDPHNASADVVVVKPARVWTISPQAFDRFVEEDPKAGFTLMKVLARELCRRLRHTSDTMLKQIESTRSIALEHDY